MTIATQLLLTDNNVYDTFNRPDGMGLGQTDTGQAWVVSGPAGSKFGIINGKAYCDDTVPETTHSFAVVNAPSSWASVSADITWVTGASVGLAIRYGNINQNMFCRIGSTGIGLFRNDNSIVEIGSYAFTPANGSVYSVRLVARGNTYYVFLYNVLRITVTDPFGVDYTGVGLRSYTPGQSRWANFKVEV